MSGMGAEAGPPRSRCGLCGRMHDRLRIVNREWSNSAENVDGGPRPPR